MKFYFIFMIALLILLFGCAEEKDNCPCCCGTSNTQTPYNTYVVCDNQQIWDNRGSIPNFRCACINDEECDNFPVKRVCVANIFFENESGMYYQEKTITCTEIIGQDRRCE